MMSIKLDNDLDNADWTKSTWRLPPYKSEEFMKHLEATGSSLDAFRELPVYKRAVSSGLIKDDEWVGW